MVWIFRTGLYPFFDVKSWYIWRGLINNTPFVALDIRENPELLGYSKVKELMKSFGRMDY